MRRSSNLFLVSVLLVLSGDAIASDRGERSDLPPVTNAAYSSACGSCHFAYQPGLLPARSWERILRDPSGHPGGALTLDMRTIEEITSYLVKNSAENSPSKRSQKILRSAGSDAPVRISELSYIRDKHRKLSSDVFARKSVGSRANCPSCHRGAVSGRYDDDDVAIPR